MKAGSVILIADDDEEDCLLLKEAAQEAGLACQLHFVADGEELLDYLLCQGRFSDRRSHPLPQLMLIDLNMPRRDGREAIQQIQDHAFLRTIPKIVLTTSQAPSDVQMMYGLGVNSYIAKPSSFATLVQLLRTLVKYWFETVELPAYAYFHVSSPCINIQ